MSNLVEIDGKFANLRLVLRLHVRRRQNLRVYALREPGVDVLPRRPDRQTQSERAPDGEHGVPDDPPEERVEEVKHEVHQVHDRQRERGLVPTQRVPEVLVVAAVDRHADHDLDRVLERQREEEVRLGELAPEDEEPEQDGRHARGRLQRGVARRERLAGKVLARLARHTVTEHPARGQDREEKRGDDRDEELDDTEDERERASRRVVLSDRDVECGTSSKSKRNGEE